MLRESRLYPTIPEGRRRMSRLILFFDFDNTLTAGDVLDEVIATFSPDDQSPNSLVVEPELLPPCTTCPE
jgi:hypothetical protein